VDAHPALGADVKNVLGVENAVARFVSYGSTAPKEVERQVAEWKKRMKAEG
jgi:argininosuccinate lyase